MLMLPLLLMMLMKMKMKMKITKMMKIKITMMMEIIMTMKITPSHIFSLSMHCLPTLNRKLKIIKFIMFHWSISHKNVTLSGAYYTKMFHWSISHMFHWGISHKNVTLSGPYYIISVFISYSPHSGNASQGSNRSKAHLAIT